MPGLVAGGQHGFWLHLGRWNSGSPAIRGPVTVRLLNGYSNSPADFPTSGDPAATTTSSASRRPLTTTATPAARPGGSAAISECRAGGRSAVWLSNMASSDPDRLALAAKGGLPAAFRFRCAARLLAGTRRPVAAVQRSEGLTSFDAPRLFPWGRRVNSSNRERRGGRQLASDYPNECSSHRIYVVDKPRRARQSRRGRQRLAGFEYLCRIPGNLQSCCSNDQPSMDELGSKTRILGSGSASAQPYPVYWAAPDALL
jgi:hypothetical protein